MFINNNTIMKYKYNTTSDFNLGEDWILDSQCYDDVRFRFIEETYRGISKSVWMSPQQALEYIRYRSDDLYHFYSFKIVRRIEMLPF